MSRGLKTLAAPIPQRLSQWAEENFYLSKESSYQQGAWRAHPYQVAILDCMGNDEITEVDFIKSARVGYTKMLLAAMAYFAEHKRRNQALWQPTDDDADRFSKIEFDTMMRDVAVMRPIFPWLEQRHKNNTTSLKVFIGATVYLRGGKAARAYRALSVDVAILDELDGFDLDIEKEGSPFLLSGKRIEGATFPKHIVGSTPKLRGFSMVEDRCDVADEFFRFHIPCPHCRQWTQLRWGGKDKAYGFKWIDGDQSTVRHACEHCASLCTQAEFLAIWSAGRWISPNGVWIDPLGQFRGVDGELVATPSHVAFHIWTAYSPMVDWPDIVKEFLYAKAKAKRGDKAALKTFVNTTLGESWEEDVEKTDHTELMRRGGGYELRTVPRGGLVLTAGVDVQDNRFEIRVYAWGRGEECWLVDSLALEANPADERDWDKLDAYLQTRFRHASGQQLGVEATAIDTGGHFTHQVYNFCRLRIRRRIHAIKGDSKQGSPIKGRSSAQDVNFRGKIIKKGVKLWLVGTDTAKDLLFGRLKVITPGPGCMHFPKGVDEQFFEQLTSEVRVLQRTGAGEQYRWIKKAGVRNEVLDCTVYAMFAAHMLDLHRYTDRMWERLESVVQPPTADLFAQPDPAADDSDEWLPLEPTTEKPRRRTARPARTRQTFATNW